MSYEPLHHKYRPKTFADLVGQEAIATTLSNALRLSKIAPAYLFAGPRGTGKTSSARILAKSLNCLQSSEPTDKPCGVCEVCRSITNGSSLDVIEIDAASNTGVDNIRELIERSQFAPVQCRHKVYIIDECLAGDSLILTSEGFLRIDNPSIQGKQVLSYNNFSGYWEFKPVLRWFDQGTRQTLTIQTTHQEIRCTANHLIRTETGWVAAEHLKPGMRIIAPDLDIIHEYLDSPTRLKCPSQEKTITSDRGNYSLKLKHKGHSETVHWISEGKLEKVYDIEVEDHHNFVANGLNVHNCHSLSSSSFNALLKTLEEPPNHVVFVLATTDPQRVLPTIISRCQRFDFRRIPLDAMVQHLQEIAAKESINITAEAVLTVAQIAQGGLRDAESMLDQLSLLSGEITVEKVWDLVGAVPEQDLMNLLQAIAEDHPEAVLDRARGIMDRGREPLVVLQNLTSFYRDLLIAKTASDRADLVAITPATWEELRQFAQTQELTHILQGQQHLRACEVQIKNTSQPRLWLEVALLGLLPSALSANISVVQTTAPRTVSRQSVAHSPVQPANYQPVAAPPPPTQAVPQQPYPQAVAATPAATPAPPRTPQTHQPGSVAADPAAVPAAAGTASPIASSPATANLESIWQQVLSYLPLSTKSLFSEHGTLSSLNDHEIKVEIRAAKLIKLAENKLPDIQGAFDNVLSRRIPVHLEVAGKNTAQPSQSDRVQRQPSQFQVQSQTTQSQAQQMATPTVTPVTSQPTPTPTVRQNLPSQPPLTPPSKGGEPGQPPLTPPSKGGEPEQTLSQGNGQGNGQGNVKAPIAEPKIQPKIPPKPTVSQPVSQPKPQSKPSTNAFVDESEAIAAAQKLAEMFGGTVVFDDLDPLERENVETDDSIDSIDSMSVEESDSEENSGENFPEFPDSTSEEVIEAEGSLAENQQPAENLIPTSEDEDILSGLVGEEFGGLEF